MLFCIFILIPTWQNEEPAKIVLYDLNIKALPLRIWVLSI